MPKPLRLAVSIVTYAPELKVLERTLVALNNSLKYAKNHGMPGYAQLWLVDNGPGEGWRATLQALLTRSELPGGFDAVELLSGHSNIGYGAGHNLIVDRFEGDFHLVLNPDVLLAEEALLAALKFMIAYPEVGLLAPAAVDSAGNRIYLCKRYPTLLDLFLRGFTPALLKKIFRRRLNRYEMHDLIGNVVIMDVPIVSGCCMLFRHSALTAVKGFSPEFFLYFEDFDISLRVAAVARTAYVPSVRIVHFGGHAARKGWRHIDMFLRSAITFFSRHGWRWL